METKTKGQGIRGKDTRGMKEERMLLRVGEQNIGKKERDGGGKKNYKT